MKKVFKITIIISIILILGIVILFCSKINKISLIENIKQKIAKTEEIQTANEVTTIDVTDLEDNENLEHEHIFKTMYDENKHWEECTVCGKFQNEMEHSFTTTWNLGSESCLYNNGYTKTCPCGYSKTGHKPCVWDGKSYRIYYFTHQKLCSNCKNSILYEYYYNGTLYNKPFDSEFARGNEDLVLYYELCHDDNGIMDCNNFKNRSCKICKKTYNKPEHALVTDKDTGIIYCIRCFKEYGKVIESTITNDLETPVTYTLTDKIILTNGAKLISSEGIPNSSNIYLDKDQYSITNKNTDGSEFTAITIAKSKSSYKQWFNSFHQRLSVNIDGQAVTMDMVVRKVSPDLISPEITEITTENENTLTEWSKTKPIIVMGTENFCDTVSIEIIDNEKNIIFSGNSIVKDKKFSISCIPEIEVGVEGREFKVIIKDAFDNIAEQEFTIAKVDIVPPTSTSGTEILGDWAKSKDFTFTATDYGIGEVSIAFNDIEDLQLAKVNENTYSRDYKFTGDVYKPKQLSVMYKDGLGNTSMQKITIDKIDNTAPTITNVEIHNNTITITSNDEHETLGEGSGVVKYRYLASEEKIENPTLTIENSTEVNKTKEIKIKDIYKMKYIYVIAEDYVGNTSEVYEFKVPELKLTATVNPNTPNGKGEIILNWSSYDVADKYFVIYRKKENQENWETIVNLEQRLTGSTYTDILANDEVKPNIQSITITGDTENNNINVTANSSDNGTQYNYYIEAYDSTGELLSK